MLVRFPDLRHAVRALRRSPAYTIVALLTLVLGIGANAAVFSIVDHVLIAPLQLPASDRLVELREMSGKGRSMQVAWHNFEDWRRDATRLESVFAHTRPAETTLLGLGQPLRASMTEVSDGFLRTLAVRPALGRGFVPEDHRFGADPVALVSDAFWRTELGAARDLSAVRLDVGGFRMRVVGVMPPGFDYPHGAEVWAPLELEELGDSRTSHNFIAVGRLAAGATAAQAKQELDAITRRFATEDPGELADPGAADYFPRAVAVRPLREALVGDMRRPLWILLGASLLVLLVACTNLASTTLARGTGREHEYAIRHALGAGRGRMVRVVVTEVLVLALAGGLLGLALAFGLLRVLPALAPAGLPRLAEVRLDGRAVAFTFALALLATSLAGLLPGLRVSGNAIRTLRSGGRGGDEPRRQRIWKGLVAVEMALALVLLVGSGLLLRSFRSVLEVRPGFRTEGVLTATLDPPASKYGDADARRVYYEAVAERLRALPGVAAAGLVTAAPMEGASSQGLVQVAGGPRPNASGYYQLADAGYFRALDIPLLRGRLFQPADAPGGDHVVLVSHAFAALAWPGENPIGKRITAGGMDNWWDKEKWATVVGEVGDVRQADLTAPPQPIFYFPYRQRPFRSWTMTAVLRPAAGPPAALGPAVRAAVRDVDADVPVRLQTMRARLSGALAARRFIMLVISGFAALALVLAGIGVYGVVGYAVERRRREIGIRLALGAEPRAVRHMLQREYLAAGAAGAVVGSLAAIGLTRALAGLLFAVAPTDPLTFLAVLVVLAAAGWLASLVPALRSSRIEPVEMMRGE